MGVFHRPLRSATPSLQVTSCRGKSPIIHKRVNRVVSRVIYACHAPSYIHQGEYREFEDECLGQKSLFISILSYRDIRQGLLLAYSAHTKAW